MKDQNQNNGDLSDNQQFYDEKDLDSQRSKDDVDTGNNLDDEYDAQMLKMQECLVSYFENVEEIKNKGTNKVPKKQPQV